MHIQMCLNSFCSLFHCAVDGQSSSTLFASTSFATVGAAHHDNGEHNSFYILLDARGESVRPKACGPAVFLTHMPRDWHFSSSPASTPTFKFSKAAELVCSQSWGTHLISRGVYETLHSTSNFLQQTTHFRNLGHL